MNLFRGLLASLALVTLIGCGGAPKELSKINEPVTWPALQAIQAPEVSMVIFRSAAMNDWASAKKALSDPKMTELVEALSAEAIPAKFASPARDKAKQQVVDLYKAVIAAAKGGSAKDLKEGIANLQKALGDLVNPDLK